MLVVFNFFDRGDTKRLVVRAIYKTMYEMFGDD